MQADAQARITGAALLPAVGVRRRRGEKLSARSMPSGDGATGGQRIRESYSASLSASYEIDFWGKNRAALRAAEQTAVATRYDREVVALSTVVAVGATPISRCWRRRTA